MLLLRFSSFVAFSVFSVSSVVNHSLTRYRLELSTLMQLRQNLVIPTNGRDLFFPL
jgi:hypothetical protein